MKYLILLTIFFSCSVASAQHLTAEFSTREKLPDWIKPKILESANGHFYKLVEEMNPFYLEADFNGQGSIDIAIYIVNSKTDESGIVIIHQEDSRMHFLGAGTEFNEMTNFNWMELWKLYREKSAEITLFSEDYDIIGSETIDIQNTSIELGQIEGSSNLIAWDGEKYSWIHTGD